MKQLKHTPGPWVVEKSATVFEIFSGDATTLVATSRRSLLSSKMDESAEANARLIAAAPELLEALKACADVLSVFVQDGTSAQDSVVDKILKQSIEAIAKATGAKL